MMDPAFFICAGLPLPGGSPGGSDGLRLVAISLADHSRALWTR
jgi:hypothetical protein